MGIIILSSYVQAGNFTLTANNSITNTAINTFQVQLNNNYFHPYSLQETANVSTSFGGKATGTYGFVGVPGTGGYMYINYSKNDTFAALPIWQVRHGLNMTNTSAINAVINYTIPQSCWDASTTNIQLRMFTSATSSSGTSYGQCLNSSGWNTITEINTASAGSAGFTGSSGSTDYSYDTNYSTGIYYTLGGSNIFRGVNTTSYFNYPENVAAVIWEEGLWWYDGGNLTYSTTTGSIVTNITNPVGRVYDVTFTSTGYETRTYSAHNTSTNLTGMLNPYQLNLTFFDENTTALLNGTLISFSITGGNYSYNNTTLTGSAVISVVTNNISINIIYSATGYNQRNYYTNLTTVNTSISLFLRSTSTSSVLQINIIDQELNDVQNAYVYQTVKNLSGTNYYTTEICQTDINGECLMTADIASTTYLPSTVYNFLVYYNGILRGATGDKQLGSNTLQIQIDTGSNSLVNFFELNSLQYTNITFNSATNEFSFTMLDPYSNINTICLRTYMITGATSTQSNGTCISATLGTLTVSSNTSLGDQTIAIGSIYYDGSEYQLDTYTVVNETGGTNYRTMYLIFVFLGVLLTMFLGVRYLATTAIIMLAGVTFILVRVSGSILPIIAVTGLVGMGIIIWMRMKGE